jgi:hypothetical protein
MWRVPGKWRAPCPRRFFRLNARSLVLITRFVHMSSVRHLFRIQKLAVLRRPLLVNFRHAPNPNRSASSILNRHRNVWPSAYVQTRYEVNNPSLRAALATIPTSTLCSFISSLVLTRSDYRDSICEPKLCGPRVGPNSLQSWQFCQFHNAASLDQIRIPAGAHGSPS